MEKERKTKVETEQAVITKFLTHNQNRSPHGFCERSRVNTLVLIHSKSTEAE